ncbi:MAG: hypothetical protein HQL74_09975 [Magnetococcales bacterium]|nr:hypothetical protein [Magnetococcales bacterium]
MNQSSYSKSLRSASLPNTRWGWSSNYFWVFVVLMGQVFLSHDTLGTPPSSGGTLTTPCVTTSCTEANFDSTPTNLSTASSIKPQVMLAAAKDHRLYYKAYDDFSDIDGDGVIDNTYRHSIDYYGYFDSYKCYDYVADTTANSVTSGTVARFEPKSVNNGLASTASASDRKYCTGTNNGYWSGNFLNWLTMTRMDVVRKILFGGYRRNDAATDSSSTSATSGTILERSYLPHDAHSFAKYYNGSDLASLSPFEITPSTTPVDLSNKVSATSNTIATGSKTFTITGGVLVSEFSVNDYVDIYRTDSGTAVMAMQGYVSATPFSTSASATGTIVVNILDTFSTSTTALTSWKVVNRSWIGRVTKTSTTSQNIGTGSKTFTVAQGVSTATNEIMVNDLMTVYKTSGTEAWAMKGLVTAVTSTQVTVNVTSTNGSGSGITSWKLVDNTRAGISFCNTTDTASTGNSETITAPPLLKIIKGNYSLWASNERWQCTWASGAPVDNHAITTGSTGTNSNDPIKSGLDAFPNSPSYPPTTTPAQGNYVVRVHACVPSLLGSERCKQYPGGNYKPIGLLQVYGDDGSMNFGMMAGSYTKNKSGGDLVKNTGLLSDEINVNTDGTFKKVYSGVTSPNGVASNTSEGIINAWSLYRIIRYRHSDGTYGTSGTDSSNCTWGLNTFANNQCQNWGNPFAEIVFNVIRYFAGKSSSTVFDATDSSLLTGLNYAPAAVTTPATTTPWADPLNDPYTTSSPPSPHTSANYCARAFTVLFNSSTLSYDGDELDGSGSNGVASLSTSGLTSTQLTDLIGVNEGIHSSAGVASGTYLVGSTPTSSDGLCTPKSVTGLGSVLGICPEAPRLSGTYKTSGLAYLSHTQDLRPGDVTIKAANPTYKNKLDLYSVQLSSGVPQVTIAIPGGTNTLTILPACRNTTTAADGNPIGNCAIVDFKVVADNFATNGTGKFYINWEDSEQGGDYDQDMWGTMDVALVPTNGVSGPPYNQVTITTQVLAQSTPNIMGFGYILNGTTNQDGFHAHSGINGFVYTDPGPTNCGTTGCKIRSDTSFGPSTIGTASSATYTLGTGSAGLLKDPLWYAAKYGGFDTSTATSTWPTPEAQTTVSSVLQNTTWDKTNNSTGASGADGIPDNYYYAANPAQLESALNRAFLDILQRTSSGTAAAVVAATVDGVGATYQAYFEPLRQDIANRKVTWIGSLQALWIDKYGFLRMDGNQNGQLDNYLIDKVVQTYFDSVDNKTKVKVYTTTDSTGTTFTPPIATTPLALNPNYTVIDLDEVTPLWNARKQLSSTGLDATITSQRDASVNQGSNFTVTADTGRHIVTWLDVNNNGIVDTGEIVNFDTSAIDATKYGFFNLPNSTNLSNLVNYIRGQEISGYRNRTINYTNATSGTAEVMRLGDIVNSTPAVVGAPKEAYDLLYSDPSYATFKSYYANRRQMVYVGANDGLLHAFNGGFFNAATLTFSTSGKKPDGAAAMAHPLGSEIWAYLPMNLQPHLQWLTSNSYSHVFYMDAKPRTFDAKIFTADSNHPGGWGTVLVAGMRLGGGPMTITPFAGMTGLATGLTSASQVTRRSAFVLLDITNPELAPKVMAEIPLPDGTFTTNYPTVMGFRDVIVPANDANKWYLVVGSGPNSLSAFSMVSNQTPNLYVYDLANLSSGPVKTFPLNGAGTATTTVLSGPSAPNTFIGNPVAVDWGLNYGTDAIYFGLVGDLPANTGKLIKWPVNRIATAASWTTPPFVLFNTGLPSVFTPTLALDELKNHWVFGGSGRFFIDSDKGSITQQELFGFRDKEDGATLTTSHLMNVTNVQVYSDGSIENGTVTPTLNTTTNTYTYTITNNTPVCKLNNCTTYGTLTTLSGLESYIQSGDADGNGVTDYLGWYRTLGYDGSNPSERVVTQMPLIGGTLVATSYTPNADLCQIEGTSNLYGLYYKTGTTHSSAILSSATLQGATSTTKTLSLTSTSLGRGLATSPDVHIGTGKSAGDVTVVVQQSTGAIGQADAKLVTKTERSGEISWREFLQ